MTNWIAKLDDFMRISDREILTNAGKVSHEAALARAEPIRLLRASSGAQR